MDESQLSWDDLRVAIAAEQAGSLSAVSRRLGISVATAGRRLDRLEQALGQRLFTRAASGLTPTPEAETLLSHLHAVAEEVEALMRASAAGRGASGVVTVSTLETIVTHALAPRLPEFRSRNPGIDLVLRSTPRIVRLERRKADLAVRVGKPLGSREVGRRLGTLRYGLYAHPNYLQTRGRPADPAHSLEGHDVVLLDEAWDALPEMAWVLERTGGGTPAFRVSTTAAQAATVHSGAALGVVPVLLANAELERLVEPEELPSRDLWLILHEDLRTVPRVRAVADFIIDVFQRLLSG